MTAQDDVTGAVEVIFCAKLETPVNAVIITNSKEEMMSCSDEIETLEDECVIPGQILRSCLVHIDLRADEMKVTLVIEDCDCDELYPCEHPSITITLNSTDVAPEICADSLTGAQKAGESDVANAETLCVEKLKRENESCSDVMNGSKAECDTKTKKAHVTFNFTCNADLELAKTRCQTDMEIRQATVVKEKNFKINNLGIECESEIKKACRKSPSPIPSPSILPLPLQLYIPITVIKNYNTIKFHTYFATDLSPCK